MNNNETSSQQAEWYHPGYDLSRSKRRKLAPRDIKEYPTSAHHVTYRFDKPLLCDNCEHNVEGEDPNYPGCEWFAYFDPERGITDWNGDGTDAVVYNKYMHTVFRRLGERPEFNVTHCRKFKQSFGKTYSDYLKSDYWKRTRKKKLREADFRCERCGSGINLSVHHLSYEHLGEEPLEDLVVLCRNCHTVIHGKDVEK